MKTDFYYVGYDLFGYPYNSEFPPNNNLYGSDFGGYKNCAAQVLFYDFAVQMYDVKFKYNGKTFYLLYCPDHAALCDDKFTTEFIVFASPNDLIKNLEIGNKKLIDIIDDISEIEPV